jgi:hypothetical protein
MSDDTPPIYWVLSQQGLNRRILWRALKPKKYPEEFIIRSVTEYSNSTILEYHLKWLYYNQIPALVYIDRTLSSDFVLRIIEENKDKVFLEENRLDLHELGLMTQLIYGGLATITSPIGPIMQTRPKLKSAFLKLQCDFPTESTIGFVRDYIRKHGVYTRTISENEYTGIAFGDKIEYDRIFPKTVANYTCNGLVA